MEAARTLLERHLDIDIEPSLAVRAVYGQYFALLTYLDAAWAKGIAESIFPREDGLRRWWWAAWSTYVQFTAAYDNIFALLRDHYALAIKRLDEGPATDNRDHTAEHLGSHLIIFYWRGLLSLEPQDLLWKYMQRATPDLRAAAIAFVGRSLLNSPGDVPTSILCRLRALWDARMLAAVESKNKSLFKKELGSFSFWFSSGKFDNDWAIRQLKEVIQLVSVEPVQAFTVIKRLAQIAPGMPAAAIECLELIVAAPAKSGFYFHGMQEVRDILEAARSSGDVEIINNARRVASVLAERGDLTQEISSISNDFGSWTREPREGEQRDEGAGDRHRTFPRVGNLIDRCKIIGLTQFTAENGARGALRAYVLDYGARRRETDEVPCWRGR